MGDNPPCRVVAWSEGSDDGPLYPHGIRAEIARALHGVADVQTCRLGEPLDLTDCEVLFFWGHAWHDRVSSDMVHDIVRHVTERGMGFVALHSAHFSRPFQALLGCTGRLAAWREAAEKERLWFLDPAHPLAAGLPNPIDIDTEEMYSEPFEVPPPDDLVAVSWFAGGEIFRSICAWQRGRGKVVYFRPGHEEYRTFHLPAVHQFLRNAAGWAATRP